MPSAPSTTRAPGLLGSREAECRLALGREATTFLAAHGHQHLTFARLGDYTRERLGISARELRLLAHVASALEDLPRIRAAFTTGALSWTKTRLLADVARPENEAFWLRRAEHGTATALDELIRRTNPRAEPRLSTSDDASDRETIDGEPPARFRLPCTRGVRRMWHWTVELARRVSGEQGPVWRAADAIAAEALSGAPTGARRPAPLATSPAEVRSRPLPAGPPTQDAPRCQPHEASCTHGSDRDGAFTEPTDAERTATPALRRLADPVRTDPADPARTDPADPARTDPATSDARMRALLVELRTLDFQIGAALRQAVEAKQHRHEGFASIEAYARERFGLSAGKARTMIVLDRRAALLPPLREAYARGTLSWVRAVELLPVLTRSNAAAWVARAGEVTVRRLEAEVAWALDHNDAAPGSMPAPPDPGTSGRQIRARLTGAEEIPRTAAERAPLFPLDAEISFVGPRSVVTLLHEMIAAFGRPREPRSAALARLLAHVSREWLGQPRHRDPVFARDGWRCAVPACAARRNLHDHHVRYRSRGGGNARTNRVTVCAWHHLRAIHLGRVRVRGTAPDALSWELGVDRAGRPWLRLEGDRYVRTASRGGAG